MVLTHNTHASPRYYLYNSFETVPDQAYVYDRFSFRTIYVVDISSKQNRYGGKRYIPWC